MINIMVRAGSPHLVVFLFINFGALVTSQGMRGKTSFYKECREFKDNRMKTTCRSISLNPLFYFDIAEIEPDREPIYDSGLSDSDPPLLSKSDASSSFLSGNQEMHQKDENPMSRSNTRSRFWLPSINIRCIIAKFRGLKERHRSITPWVYNMNENNMRFPRQVPFVKCLCKGCLDYSNPYHENINLASEPLTTEATVLMRKSATTDFVDCNATTCYEEIIEVPIGCHCVHPTDNS